MVRDFWAMLFGSKEEERECGVNVRRLVVGLSRSTLGVIGSDETMDGVRG